MEIGHKRELSELLDVFDVAARNAVFFTATGVSDDHAGADWIRQRANYLTYVWAESTELPDLLGGLRAGRSWFLDPGSWRGALDVRVEDRPAMGGVLCTAAERVAVRVDASDLPAGASLDIVTGPVDRLGADEPKPATSVVTIAAGEMRRGRHEFDIQPGDGSYLRAQIRDGAGNVIGVGNPTWLLRSEDGIPERRRIL